MTLFDIIANLTYKKVPIDFSDSEQEKSYDMYSIDTALSMCEILVDVVESVSSMKHLTKQMHHDIYFSILPQRRFDINFIKKTDKNIKDDIEAVSNYYQVTIRKANEYLSILTKEELAYIKSMSLYGRIKK